MEDEIHLNIGMMLLANILIGTGTITTPAMFHAAGYILSPIANTIYMMFSYVALLFILEALSNLNFLMNMNLQKVDPTSGKLWTIWKGKMNAWIGTVRERFSRKQLKPIEESIEMQETPTAPQDELEQEQSTSTVITNDNSVDETLKDTESSIINSSDELSSISGNNNNVIEKAQVVCEQANIVVDVNQNIEEIAHHGGEPLAQNEIPQVQLTKVQKIEQLKTLKHLFAIELRFELGQLVRNFLPTWLQVGFFFVLSVYGWGCLAISDSAMSKSLVPIGCTSNFNVTEMALEDVTCRTWFPVTRDTAYYLLLVAIVMSLWSLTYVSMSNVMKVHIFTNVVRLGAIFIMTCIGWKVLIAGQGTGAPSAANFGALPNLMGIMVIGWMCHHSIAGVVNSIGDKTNLLLGITILYALVWLMDLTYNYTAIFAFGTIGDLYTLNFQPNSDGSYNPAYVPGIDYFLALYPVLTIVSSYTIVTQTLISNFKVLINIFHDLGNETFRQRHGFPLLALVPPLCIAMLVGDVSTLMSYVGSYGGTSLQYLFPALLIRSSRIVVRKNVKAIVKRELPYLDVEEFSKDELYRIANPYAKLFQHDSYWIIMVIWWGLNLVVVTYNKLF